MAKGKSSRLAEAMRKHALSYPQAHEVFPRGESAFKVRGKTFGFRAVAPRRLVAELADPPRPP